MRANINLIFWREII